MTAARARAAAATLLAGLLLTAAPAPAAPARPAPVAAALLEKADADFAALKLDTRRQRLRDSYVRVLDGYRRVFEGAPRTRQAETALLRAGELHALLYTWTRQAADLNRAQHYYQRLVTGYPKSPLADDAQLAIGRLYLDLAKSPAEAYVQLREVARVAPGGDRVAEANRLLRQLARYAPPDPPAPPSPDALTALACPTPAASAPAPAPAPAAAPAAPAVPGAPAAPTAFRDAGPPAAGIPAVLARVRGIRNWSNPEYTRVVIDLDREAHFYANLLEDSGTAGRPPRLYVDIFQSLVEPRLCQTIPVNDGILRTVRAGQFTPESVRVVLDIDRLRSYRIFPMGNPFRLVVDVTGGDAPAEEEPPPVAVAVPPVPAAVPAPPAPPAEGPAAVPSTVVIARVVPAPPPAPEPAAVPAIAIPAPIVPLPPPETAPAPAKPAPAAPAAAAAPPPAAPPAAKAAPPAGKPTPLPPGRLSLARQLGLGVRRVVIDAGHGAHDPGAIGVGGLQEKEVTLDLAVRVRDLLAAQGLEVVLTRDRDVYLPLEERTAIANKERGDLFLSLHCNASDKGDLQGVETYFLNLASSERAQRTAARENSMAIANISDLNAILKQIFNSKMDESSRFADQVQRSLHGAIRRRHRDVKNLGVKQAPFYVLIGAEMPSVLAEVSFINHPVEGRRLADPAYRQLVAQALADAVRRYAGSVKLAAAAPPARARASR